MSSSSPPEGIRTTPSSPTHPVTRLVLVRHGEAVCNVSGVCGGRTGCTGLTERGIGQVEKLRDRLAVTGELAGTGILYASVLPRAIQTAEILAPALAGGDAPALSIISECGLCELHPGEADALTWAEFAERFGRLDWDEDPDQVIAPGGESWTGFVNRAADMLVGIAERHPDQSVVVACHAGVIEASLLGLLPVAGGRQGARLQLRTQHASMTSWEIDDGRWRLLGYNDAAHLLDGALTRRPGRDGIGTESLRA